MRLYHWKNLKKSLICPESGVYMQILIHLKQILQRAQKKCIGLLVIISIISSILDAISVGLVLPLLSIIIDKNFINNNLLIKLFSFLQVSDYEDKIIVFSCILICFYLMKTLLQVFILAYQSNYYASAIQNLSVDLLEKYLRADYLFHVNSNSSELIRNIKTEIPLIFSRVLAGVINILSDTVLLVGIVAVLLIFDPLTTIIGFVTLGFINLLFFKSIKHKIKILGEVRQAQEAESYKWINQSLGGIKELKVLDRIKYFINKSSDSYAKLRNSAVYSDIMGKAPKIVIEGLALTMLVSLTLVLILTTRSAELVIPRIALFSAALFKLMPAVNRLMGETINVRFSRPALDIIIDAYNNIKQCEMDIIDLNQGDAPLLFSEIKINKLYYRYPGTEKKIISDFSLTIQKNESIGIIGSSGSGKTTLLNILLGLLSPQSGSIMINNIDILKKRNQWKKMIGFVPQDIFLLDDTIRANVAYGIEAGLINDDTIWEVLELAQIADFIRDMPDQLDTTVGDRGVRLSGGQRQRIGIARALWNDPEILIFDEATSSLDNETEADITKAIDSLMNKKTIIIVAHRLTTLKNCNRIISIENGKATDAKLVLA
jgi:ATP-binding cassette, subfamily B, bacterial PglK